MTATLLTIAAAAAVLHFAAAPTPTPTPTPPETRTPMPTLADLIAGVTAADVAAVAAATALAAALVKTGPAYLADASTDPAKVTVFAPDAAHPRGYTVTTPVPASTPVPEA